MQGGGYQNFYAAIWTSREKTTFGILQQKSSQVPTSGFREEKKKILSALKETQPPQPRPANENTLLTLSVTNPAAVRRFATY